VDVNSDKGQDIITPDGDGLNDGLEFEEIETEPAKSGNDIIILNRWGQPVYTAKPYNNDWKGQSKSGNELPEGSYYYVLYLRDGKKEVIYGSVLLIR
jgi:large repetitive protein